MRQPNHFRRKSISAQPKKVLVVDDDQSMVTFVRTALEVEEYEVIDADDGLTGLSRAHEDAPDLIILDVYLPGESGFFVLRNLKSDSKTKDIPVVMLTGIGRRLGIVFSTRDFYDFLGVEPDAYLEKPVDPIFLRLVTGRLLGMDPAVNGPGARNN
jgi:two-component system alkaline phosphatase synthesis response regulator PhoP